MLRFPEQYECVQFMTGRLYRIPFNGIKLTVIATLDTDDNGITWEHVSVSLKNRLPTWQELKFIKMLWFLIRAEQVRKQFFPPQSEYINVHKNCLHLWRPINVDLPWRKKS